MRVVRVGRRDGTERVDREADAARATRTSIRIDRELAAEAAEILGTRTLTTTVDAALREVVGRGSRAQLVERLRTGHGIDLEMLDRIEEIERAELYEELPSDLAEALLALDDVEWTGQPVEWVVPPGTAD